MDAMETDNAEPLRDLDRALARFLLALVRRRRERRSREAEELAAQGNADDNKMSTSGC
jgi:hypothetical protein